MAAQILDPLEIDIALSALKAGKLVGVPTETVYGLAADAFNNNAVAAIYAAKERPEFNPLICHVSSRDMANSIAKISPLADRLITAFWPGPLTLVMPARAESGISPLVSAGLSTLAVRMPKTEVTRNLIEGLGRPIAAPSANLSGKISPTCVADVTRTMAETLAYIIDGGPCSMGLESTIIAVDNNSLTLLRPGIITSDEITAVCSVTVSVRDGSSITAPGQMSSHYAPDMPLRLNCTTPSQDEFYIGYGQRKADYNLSQHDDLCEAASRLFSALHAADASGKAIAVAPVPKSGIGLAINDRLARAAAPREL